MANFEQLFIGDIGVNLTGDPAGTYVLEEIAFPPPKPRHEWISAADSEGAALMRAPQHENREITARVRIAQQSTMDLMFDKIGVLLDRFAKARGTPDGLPVTWVPTTSSRSVIFTMLDGEIEGMPIDWNGSGWFSRQAAITLKMTCEPYWYGTETSVSAVTNTLPVQEVQLPAVPGDVPALGRLVVTDNATQNRRYVEWGLETEYNASAATVLDSDADLSITGYAGAQATVTGAYDPNATGNNAITASLLDSPIAICGTGNRVHVGTWRVRARVKVTVSGGTDFSDISAIRWRLAWRDGDGPMALNQWAGFPIATNGWQEVDLGTITVSEAKVGTQRWSGRVDAYRGAGVWAGTTTVAIDYLKLIPTSGGYGKARTPLPSTEPEVINAYDSFTGTTAGGALNARVAPVGGTWTTSGTATDFLFSDDIAAEVVKRSADDSSSGTGRVALLGTTTYTGVVVGLDHYIIAPYVNSIFTYVFARYTDASNFVAARVQWNGDNYIVRLYQRIAGAETTLATKSSGNMGGYTGWYNIRLVVHASGQAVAVLSQGDSTSPSLTPVITLAAANAALATGGTLATGKVGFGDMSSSVSGTSNVRYYENITVGTPASEQLTIASGQSIELRHDDVLREDSGGTVYGRPGSYRGSRFLVPPAGTDATTSRVVVHAHRNDLDTNEHTPLADSLTAQVFYQPRGLAVPR